MQKYVLLSWKQNSLKNPRSVNAFFFYYFPSRAEGTTELSICIDQRGRQISRDRKALQAPAEFCDKIRYDAIPVYLSKTECYPMAPIQDQRVIVLNYMVVGISAIS